MASTSAASTPRLFGCVVTTLQGNPLWQGWLFKPNAKLQTKPLCIAVATVFQKQPQQDTSFIKTGPYAVASVRDGDYIVSVVCGSACPDTEILMKAKEIVHNVNTLLGSEQASPVPPVQRPNWHAGPVPAWPPWAESPAPLCVQAPSQPACEPQSTLLCFRQRS